MQGSCLVERCGDSDLVQTKKEVFDGQVALVILVPLVKDALKVCARGILAAEGSSDVLKMLWVHCVSQSVLSSFLGEQVGQLREFVFHSITNSGLEISRLIFGHILVPLACISSDLGCNRYIVSSEHLVSPLFLLEFFSARIRHKHRGFRFLALSVIELNSRFNARVWLVLTGPAVVCFQRHLRVNLSCLLIVRLGHRAYVCKLHGGVEIVIGISVSLGAEVHVG